RLLPNASDEDLLSLGPKLHEAEGIVIATPLNLNINIREGKYSGEFLWTNSYEATTHMEDFGVHTDAVCWTLVGYACGYSSEIMGRFILHREVECIGKGDRHCHNFAKPLEEWDDNARQDMKYFEPDRVADQIMQLQTEVEHLRYSLDEGTAFGGMVGESEPYRASCQLLEKAADSMVTVLLLGETGVGKEVFARALHSISPREKNQFVAINCAAIPEELLESELFGVEKGAYTGAQQSRPGRFERAHGGTLFLDEVGDLSTAAQAKLLRVLQEGEFERVGDTRTRKVDVRLVAATNIDLKKAVDDGEFRADLFYRLNIYPLVIPPLRERHEDIPLLTNYFLNKYTARHGKRTPGISAAALDALNNYDWPGNIRELEHMIERGVIIAGNDELITPEHLFPRLQFETPPSSKATPVQESETATEVGDRDSLKTVVERVLTQSGSFDKVESLFLSTVVERCEGNLASAARMLGITRPQLVYRLKKHRTD
ncbi:MAG: sigma 54-interacting transcriptional regulator, partial [Pseudomonadales bacterium]